MRSAISEASHWMNASQNRDGEGWRFDPGALKRCFRLTLVPCARVCREDRWFWRSLVSLILPHSCDVKKPSILPRDKHTLSRGISRPTSQRSIRRLRYRSWETVCVLFTSQCSLARSEGWKLVENVSDRRKSTGKLPHPVHEQFFHTQEGSYLRESCADNRELQFSP